MRGFLPIKLKMETASKLSLADFNVMAILLFASSFKEHCHLATAFSVFGPCVFSVFGRENSLSKAAPRSLFYDSPFPRGVELADAQGPLRYLFFGCPVSFGFGRP